MAFQYKDFPQSYVAISLTIAASNLICFTTFYCLDPNLFLKVLFDRIDTVHVMRCTKECLHNTHANTLHFLPF